MSRIMKTAVNQEYWLRWLQKNRPLEFDRQVSFGAQYTTSWDDPDPIDRFGKKMRSPRK